MDYKTGKEKRVKIGDDTQLMIYAMDTFDKYPEQPSVRVAWHYLRTREIEDTKYRKDLDKMKEKIWNIYNAITTEEYFDPKWSYLCSFCEIQSECPLMISKEARNGETIFMKLPERRLL